MIWAWDFSGSNNLGMNLPHENDDNYYEDPSGAKIWLVPTADYNGTMMTGWHADKILFEHELITYEDPDM